MSEDQIAPDAPVPAEASDRTVTINNRKLRDALAVAVTESLEDLLEGAEEDLRHFALSTSDQLVLAMSAGRDDLVDELLAQVHLLAEINRVRAVNKGWDTVRKILRALLVFSIGLAR